MQNKSLLQIKPATEQPDAYYQQLFDYAPIGLLTLTAEGFISRINLNAANLFQQDRNELLNRRFASLITPHNRARWSLLFNDVIKINTRLRHELRLKRNDGTVFYAELDCQRLSAEGQEPSLLISLTDITEHKQADAEKNHTLALLDTLLNSAPVGFAFLDCELRFLRINECLANMHGIPAKLHIGRHISEIIPNIAETAQEVASSILETSQAVCNYEFSGETAASLGSMRYWNASWYPIHGSAEKIIGFGVVVEDITERKFAEQSIHDAKQRIRLATEATGVGIWEWNLLTNQVKWDAQSFRIYGLPPTGDGLISYNTWKQTVLPEDFPEQERMLRDTIRQGHNVRVFRINRVDDGQCRYIQAVDKVRTNEEGQVESIVGTNLDITERKQAEQVLKDASRRKDEFLAMLAHELRNPLGPIRNIAQLLKAGQVAPEQLSWCGEVVERQVSHLSHLVDELLDISCITLGKIELKKESLTVKDFILPAVETVQPLIDANRQTFTLELPERLLWVEGDQVRLTQVVANLINNASKYTDKGGHIRLAVEQHKNEVRLHVYDTGCGIESSDLASVFDLFYQTDTDIARTKGGLGIGLSLVHRLAKMHGGDVQAFSAGLGQGSEFVVRLPLLNLPGNTIPAIAKTNSSSRKTRQRLLVVDDYHAAAESLAMLLESEGHQVWIAHDGRAAVEIALDKRPQAVILDIGLPVMDGYAVAKKLREYPELSHTRILALSGYAPPDEMEMPDFDGYLVKPANIEKLREFLEQYPC
jgi:PAS domain S-box-containing protein